MFDYQVQKSTSHSHDKDRQLSPIMHLTDFQDCLENFKHTIKQQKISDKNKKLYTFNNLNASQSLHEYGESSELRTPDLTPNKSESSFDLSISIPNIHNKFNQRIGQAKITPIKLQQLSPVSRRALNVSNLEEQSNKQNSMGQINQKNAIRNKSSHPINFSYLKEYYNKSFGINNEKNEQIVIKQEQLLMFTHKFAEEKVRHEEQINQLHQIILELKEELNRLALENSDLHQCLNYKTEKCDFLEKQLVFRQKIYNQTSKTSARSHKYSFSNFPSKSSFPSSCFNEYSQLQEHNQGRKRQKRQSYDHHFQMNCEQVESEIEKIERIYRQQNQSLKQKIKLLEIQIEHLEQQKTLDKQLMEKLEVMASQIDEKKSIEDINIEIDNKATSTEKLLEQKNIEIEIYKKSLEYCSKLILKSQLQNNQLRNFTQKELKDVIFRMMVPILQQEQYQ